MFRHIVVAYDESEPARAALAFVLGLAEQTGSRVTLAHAAAHGQASDWERRLERALEGAPAGLAVEAIVCPGPDPAGLLDLVERLDADLVAGGTRGVGGIRRFLIGGFSRRLVEHSPSSVLLFRGPLAEGMPQSVLVGLDGSECSLGALTVATGLAAALSASLTLVHVADYRLPFAGADPYAGVRDEIRRHGRSVLHQARQTVVAPLDVIREDLREGHVRAQLIEACTEQSPAIAVVGHRGAGGFGGLLVGSTARDLVDYGPCPVLVVRDAGPPAVEAGRH